MMGLLATAKLGGQVPVLFNVSYDLNAGEVTITATGQSPLSLAGKFSSDDPAGSIPSGLSTFIDGITLTNLFQYDFNSASTTISGTSSLSARINNSEPFLFGYGTVPFEVSTGNLTISGIENGGLNLSIFSRSEDNKFFNSGPLVLSANGSFVLSTGSAQLVFPNFSNPQGVNYTGPLNVYAGYNDSYGGASLLGTYTITVVPEPSTYAAIAGGLGLVAAVLHRRRQRARASAA